jgi:hypothetical protein
VEALPSATGCVACTNATPWTVVAATLVVHRNGLTKSAAGWSGYRFKMRTWFLFVDLFALVFVATRLSLINEVSVHLKIAHPIKAYDSFAC